MSRWRTMLLSRSSFTSIPRHILSPFICARRFSSLSPRTPHISNQHLCKQTLLPRTFLTSIKSLRRCSTRSAPRRVVPRSVTVLGVLAITCGAVYGFLDDPQRRLLRVYVGTAGRFCRLVCNIREIFATYSKQKDVNIYSATCIGWPKSLGHFLRQCISKTVMHDVKF